MERTLRVLKRAGIIIGDTIYLTLYAIFWLAAVASFAVVWLALRGLI
jgi:hypothetical protein